MATNIEAARQQAHAYAGQVFPYQPPGFVPSMPNVGTPQYDALKQAVTRAPVNIAPEDLEALKWQNWAARAGYEGRQPEAQRELVRQYYNNVLPYVASATGADPETYKSQFVIKYPNEAIKIPEASEYTQRYEAAVSMGLDGERLSNFTLTNELPEDVSAEMEARISAVARMGEDPQSEEWKAWVLSGDKSLMPARFTATVADPKNAERRQFVLDRGGDPFSVEWTPFMVSGDASDLPAQFRANNTPDEIAALDNKIRSVGGDPADPKWTPYKLSKGDAKYLPPEYQVAHDVQVAQDMAAAEAKLAYIDQKYPGEITDAQRAQFLATERLDLVADRKAAIEADAKALEETVKQKKINDAGWSAVNQAERDVDNAIRAAARTLEHLGVAVLDSQGNVVRLLNNGDAKVSDISGKTQGDAGSAWNPFAPSGTVARTLFNKLPILAQTTATTEAELRPLLASNAFEGLAAMKRASENGASGLGQVTEREFAALANRQANLDINQRPRELADNIEYMLMQLLETRNEIRQRRQDFLAANPEYANRPAVGALAAPAVEAAPVAPAAPAAPAASTAAQREEILRRLEGQ